jgi:DNA polymerase II large subunit
VRKVNSIKEAEDVKALVKKIIYIGDLLVSYGDFRKSAHPLIPPGYVEEWWILEVRKAIGEGKKTSVDIKKIENNLNDISEEEALKISKDLGVPLHPKYIHFYKALNIKELKLLHNYLLTAKINEDNIEINEDSEMKIFIERMGIPHVIKDKKIIITGYTKTLVKTFSLKEKKKSNKDDVLEYLSEISGIKIRDKAGSFIGARMGRPEQAKRRQMKGNPHCLYPIGLYGGNIRSINKAVDEHNNEKGTIDIEIAEYIDSEGKKTFEKYDKKTGKRNERLNYCSECKESMPGEMCKKCGGKLFSCGKHTVNLRNNVLEAKANVKVSLPDLIKGVQGLISDEKEAEPLEKGILRARHNVHIFRDGTSRFELLNATITHFKPSEIGLSVEKVKELGYKKDYEGNEITSVDQLIEIYPQDIIVNDTCGDWMLDVANFVDDELELFYKTDRFYNAKTKEDLIGTLVLGLAPHTSAAVTSRVIGYTKSRLGYGHPYFVCAKRRNVDGDQDSVMLLMDGLLNFSQKYLANRNGGKMDSAIVFSTLITPTEVDDEVYNMEIVTEYPLEFYEAATKIVEPFMDYIEIVENRLGKKTQYSGIGFTHNTTTFDEGPKKSQYIQLKSMEDKIGRQNKLQKKIMAVDGRDALERVMGSHFLPDIIGNARAFSRQTFRCTNCNEKYRRIPLCGKCYKCGNDSLILTIHQGSVRKYLKIAQNMARQENLSSYLIQRLDMIEKEIDSVFNNDKVEQKGLFDFV